MVWFSSLYRFLYISEERKERNFIFHQSEKSPLFNSFLVPWGWKIFFFWGNFFFEVIDRKWFRRKIPIGCTIMGLKISLCPRVIFQLLLLGLIGPRKPSWTVHQIPGNCFLKKKIMVWSQLEFGLWKSSKILGNYWNLGILLICTELGFRSFLN